MRFYLPQRTQRLNSRQNVVSVVLSWCPLWLVLLLPFASFAQKNKQLSEQQQMQFDAAYFNGNKEKLLGNYDEAINQFKACLYIDDTKADVYYMLADVYYTKNLMIDAEEYAKKAIALNKENIWYQILLADIYQARKKYEDGAKLHVEISKRENETGHLTEAAYLYAVAKNYSAAIKTLEQLEKIIGVNEDVIRQKEQIYMAQNKIPQAKREVEKLIALRPNETRYLGMLADLYMSSNKTKEALELYDKILLLEPENGYAHFSYADYYNSKNDITNWYKHTLAGMGAKNVDVKTRLAILVQFIGNAQNIDGYRLKCYELADALAKANPDEATAHMVKGDLYVQDNLFKEARENYLKAVELEPNTLVAWQQIVYCSGELRDNKLLQSDCEKALEYFPMEVVFYAYHAIASMQLKEYDKAVSSATKGIEHAEGNDEVLIQLYSNLGDANHYLKNDSACYAAYEKALSIDKNNAYALNNYAYFLSLRKTNLEKAEEMSKRSMDLDPNNSSYLDTYGWILFQQKRYELAKEYIEKSLVLTPNSAEVVEHLGDILFKLNQPEKALEKWKKAKEFGSDSETLEQKIKEKRYVE